ncbi:MAG: glycosyltransferase [Clostridia bacterium]|nr:glycosyltransferase [Clostridia bacterium]NCD03739.1 glycosyltransferase [Clostridia bacterium]
MKILLIHKFHYMLGGTETFHYNLAEALKAAGHEVIYFSMQDDRNIPCPQDKYFVSNVDYNDPGLKGFKKIKTGLKVIYNFEAKRKFEQLIKDEKPDIAHIGLLHRQITFSVVDVLKKYNIPIVMHLHELTAVCPCYTMLRPDGTICSDCATKGYWNCVKNKCMKGSRTKSLLAFAEAKFLQFGRYYNKIDTYIAECDFYKKLVERAQFTKSPIIRMNNFLPINQEYKAYYDHDNYILYFGRYAREKGVLTILKAYAKLNCSEKLVLVGRGSEEEKIRDFVKEHNLEDRVQINGAIFGKEMEKIIEKAKVVLVPSEWYENGAFVALQALAKGKIVVASNIAGLSEIIQDGVTGFLAEPGNPDSFATAIQKVLDLSGEMYKDMSQRIVEYAKLRCDAKAYIKQLLEQYTMLINQKQKGQ